MSDSVDSSERTRAAISRRRRFGGGVLSLELEDLIQILPQRPPLLLLDRVVSLIPGHHAVGVKRVCGDEGGLEHHLYGFVFPSTFAIEGLSQLAQIVAAGIAVPEDRDPGAPWPELVSVEAMKVHRELLAPSNVHLSVSKLSDGHALSKGEGRMVPFAGEATTDVGLFLEARLSLRLPERS